MLFVVLSLMASVVVTSTPAKAQATDDNAPITVWIDQDRQPMVDAYIKAFPDKGKLIKVSIVDREQFPAKVCSSTIQPGLAGRGLRRAAPCRSRGRCSPSIPLDLTPLVPADTLKGYAGMDGCTFGDKVYCLRNDLAQFVLYYNKPLMDKFGYAVPKTFEDLQALSDKVAKEQPGYLLARLAMVGRSFPSSIASGCPSHELGE